MLTTAFGGSCRVSCSTTKTSTHSSSSSTQDNSQRCTAGCNHTPAHVRTHIQTRTRVCSTALYITALHSHLDLHQDASEVVGKGHAAQRIENVERLDPRLTRRRWAACQAAVAVVRCSQGRWSQHSVTSTHTR
jgi:hypothetical protein